MRKSLSAPEKSEPELTARSPLQPTRSVEAVRAGSVMFAARASTSTPSRKADSCKGAAAGE